MKHRLELTIRSTCHRGCCKLLLNSLSVVLDIIPQLTDTTDSFQETFENAADFREFCLPDLGDVLLQLRQRRTLVCSYGPSHSVNIISRYESVRVTVLS